MPQKRSGVLPYNLEAEQSILGSVLIDMELQFDIMSTLKESDFYLESHKLIFTAMNSIISQNIPVDLVTLSDTMEKLSTLEKAGGMDYLLSLTRVTPSAANFRYYLDIVKRDSTLRKLIRGAGDITDEAMSSDDYNRSVAFAEKTIYDISEELDTSSLTNVKETFTGILSKFENIQKDKNFLTGIKSGFTALDNLTNGFQPGNLIILAARPSIGKTTYAMNIVENMAIKENAVCAVFALEMTKEELGQRMLCSVANVSGQDAMKGKLEPDDWQKLWEANKQLAKTRIYIDDTSMTTCPEILSKCRRLKSREGRLDVIVVDHIQLMNAVKSSDSRQQEITEISRGLKMIAKELDVPVIALSQLSRLVTSRKGQTPMLSDLRESGAIEQDADIVMFIHRPDLAAEEKDLADGKVQKNVAEIIVAKNRAGACDTFKLLFKGEKSKFINMPADYVESMAGAAQPQKGNRNGKKTEEEPIPTGEGVEEPVPQDDGEYVEESVPQGDGAYAEEPVPQGDGAKEKEFNLPDNSEVSDVF
ncbi:MAG: replicative DNA helicase [Clostridia bacterium]|nr:replicative DNA helicase [Clostridia bacterium]